ncbi:MAG: sigma-54-dependent transcriptional regulator [Thermodesulfobacteriota bacterium]
MQEMQDILVVDDDLGMMTALNEALCRKGYRVSTAASGREALEMFHDMRYRLVISDMKMPGMDGVELMRGVKKIEPTTPVLLITAFGTVKKAVEAVKEGAVDFIQKPFDLEVLEGLVDQTLSGTRGSEELREAMTLPTRSPVMSKTLAFARIAAGSDATVMISGESGTGKELLSRFIHCHSSRRDGPFVAVNCASIPDGLLESELFGFEKGAFTGANTAREGKFEQAHRGTILLDEVSEMDVRLQAKLLRVIQEREVERLGAKRIKSLDIRIIATTNRDLREEVSKGRFREDLFYRLNIFPLIIPPLRDRREDITFLASAFMKRFSTRYKRHLTSISTEAITYLEERKWPGNIRELENTIERSVLLSSGSVLTREHLLLCNLHGGAAEPAGAPLTAAPSIKGITIKDVERDLIYKTLGETGGNRTKAALMLGISIRTLRNKLKEYGAAASP